MNKRILLVTSEFPPQPGGIGNHALHLSLQLDQKGYEVSVLCDHSTSVDDEQSFDATLPIAVVRTSRTKPAFFTYLKRMKSAFLLIKKTDKVIASGKFSLWLVGFYSLFFTSKKYFAVIHGSDLGAGGKWGVRMTSWSLKRYDELIAVSQFTRELALQRAPGSVVSVINNGFSPKQSTSLSTLKHPYLSIITVGSVTSRKGQQNVIKALPLIKEYYPDVQYQIVGLPKEKKSFLALAESLNVASSVVFHGALSDEALYQQLAASKVFLMLSDHLSNGDVEGFGIAVLEANDLYLPAIGSKQSGIEDAIADGYSGKLVHPHHAQEIVEALRSILDDYQNYSKQAKEWSRKFYWENVINEYLKVLER
ncbi:glycosyltransferase family 4 protein [Flavobacterium sp. SM2513]|uniref:glycosyltransferase family 4 protein n=1 Tax=Flavobacterium sp. SM2513 TaxID=3424766 RepID=UPI003D7FE646